MPLIGLIAVDRDWLVVCCAAAVVVGHVYPVWYEFRGGKGGDADRRRGRAVAAVLVPILLSWLACVALSGYVGLGTMVATATLPVYFAFARPLSLPLLVFGVVLPRSSSTRIARTLSRTRAGVENRARRLWLLRPR